MRFPVLLCLLLGACTVRAEDMPSPATGGPVTTSAWQALGTPPLSAASGDGAPWPAGIPAQSGDASVELTKIKGSGFPVKNGLYSGGADYHGPLRDKIVAGQVTSEDLPSLRAEDFTNPGVYRLTAKTPPEGVTSIVLLVRLQGLAPGKHFTPFELIHHCFPAQLTVNGDEPAISPTRNWVVSTKLHDGFPEEIHALQWDLKPTEKPLKEWAIQLTVYPHACLTGLRVSQEKEAP